MKIVSIHSHKGGCGKTTIALFLARELALRGKRTCLLDLDISAPGVESLVNLTSGKKYFNEFLEGIEPVDELSDLEGYLFKYIDTDLQDMKQAVDLFPIGEGYSTERDIGRTVHLEYMMERLLSFLEVLQMQYDACIIDNHPSFILVSEMILKDLGSGKKRTVLFISTPNRSHVGGCLKRATKIQRADLRKALVLNRISPDNMKMYKDTISFSKALKTDELLHGHSLWAHCGLNDYFPVPETSLYRIGDLGTSPYLPQTNKMKLCDESRYIYQIADFVLKED